MERPHPGVRIRAWRLYRGWTARVLARKVNLVASVVCKIEKGRRRVHIEEWERFAAALDVTVETLWCEPPPKPAVNQAAA